jgi:WS/DGAT/MGAT family acyltransferase
MEQLSGGDSVFLAIDTPNAPAHVGGLTVLDPSNAPEFGFARLRDFIDQRIRQAPRLTRKLREVAFGLDRPYLVDDPDFDIDRHLHRIAVPSPGSMRELADLTGYLYSRPLDRNKPLWEMWFIEGVADGRVAMLMKSHHCLMDGVSGSGLGELLCDLEPQPAPRKIGRAKTAPPEKDPSDLEVALRAAGNLAQTPLRISRLAGRLLRQNAAMLSSLRDPEAPPLPIAVPKVSFNADVGPRRAFSCVSVPLEDVKALKRHFDVTVNDVILAITGSAVRRYLQGRDELPEKPLVALIAVSTRAESPTELGNQVTAVPIPWATHIDFARERLLRIHRSAKKAKDFAKAYDADLMGGMGECLPPGLVNLGMRNLGAAAAMAVPGNAVVSNVRGTPVPLYSAGARIECMYPLSVLAPGQGLNITAVSYMDRIDVGFTVDPDLVSDPWGLAEGVTQGLEELRAVMSREARRMRRVRPAAQRRRSA